MMTSCAPDCIGALPCLRLSLCAVPESNPRRRRELPPLCHTPALPVLSSASPYIIKRYGPRRSYLFPVLFRLFPGFAPEQSRCPAVVLLPPPEGFLPVDLPAAVQADQAVPFPHPGGKSGKGQFPAPSSVSQTAMPPSIRSITSMVPSPLQELFRLPVVTLHPQGNPIGGDADLAQQVGAVNRAIFIQTLQRCRCGMPIGIALAHRDH